MGDDPEIVAVPCMTCNGTGVILVPVGPGCGYGSIMCMDCLGMRELYRVVDDKTGGKNERIRRSER